MAICIALAEFFPPPLYNMPAVWSCFDVATGAFQWYTQDSRFANTNNEPEPGAWVLEEDPTDHITGFVFVGTPTQYGGDYYQFRDPLTFDITVEPIAVAEARRADLLKKAEQVRATAEAALPAPMTASFVEEVLIRRGVPADAAKSQAVSMVKKLTIVDEDWDDLG